MADKPVKHKKEEHCKKDKKTKKGSRRTRLILQLILLSFLILLLLGGIVFYITYGRTVLELQREAKIAVGESGTDTFRQTETSLVYDDKGSLLSVLKGEKDVYYLYYEDIPDCAVKAMTAIEDKKFEKHNGVDFKANVRALLALIKHKGKVTQGASTITQQLARNIFLTQEVSWQRKTKEIFIAIELEKKYEKYQIMEFYLNNIYFANGYYGIEAAARGYFSCSADELSLSQIAFLCAIPNNPTIYDPVDNIGNTLGRRDRILEQMYKDGDLSSTEYREALDEEIVLKRSEVVKKDYIETYVYYCAVRALMQKQGFVFRYEFNDSEDKESYDELYREFYNRCQRSLYSEGYRIYTSINTKQQKKLQKALNEQLKDFKGKNEEGIYRLQGAAVCIDNSSGRVTAIVGGRSQKSEGYTLNRGYQSYRQPGSAIKPLIVYTPAFERGYTPDTTVVDERFEDGPKNADGMYQGNITVRTAVEKSKNTIAWKLFEELTPKAGLSYLLQMNFARISPNDYYPAASLGGFTVGVSPVEMTSAFAAIENDGIYREPTCIVRITDAKGGIIIEDKIYQKMIYEPNASRMMTSTMQSVMKSGTGRHVSLNRMPCAGKTGTTDDKKDGWFVGYTPYYTTGVWVGYDIPKSLNDLSGGTYPGRIWQSYMEWLHQDLEIVQFAAYTDDNKQHPEVTEPPLEGLDPMEEPVPEEAREPDDTDYEDEYYQGPDDYEYNDDPDNGDGFNYDTNDGEDEPFNPDEFWNPDDTGGTEEPGGGMEVTPEPGQDGEEDQPPAESETPAEEVPSTVPPGAAEDAVP